MNNIERNPNCPMRTSLGNCDVGGGLCTSVKREVCIALHKAYIYGRQDEYKRHFYVKGVVKNR